MRSPKAPIAAVHSGETLSKVILELKVIKSWIVVLQAAPLIKNITASIVTKHILHLGYIFVTNGKINRSVRVICMRLVISWTIW